MENKELVNKAVWIRKNTHEKLKYLASVEEQSLSEYVTWFIDKAFEMAEKSSKENRLKILQDK